MVIYKFLKKGLVLCLCLALIIGFNIGVGITAKASTNSFQNVNGVMWYYNTYFNTKYVDVKNDLDNLKSRGIRILAFFSPYKGDKNFFDGCDPTNFYDVFPQNGTLQD